MKKIEIPDKLKSILEEIAHSKKYPSNIILRAKILLLSTKYSNIQIAEKLNISRKAVGKWKNKYYDNQFRILKQSEESSIYSLKNFILHFLEDKKRPGKPITLTKDQEKDIIRIAKDIPENYNPNLSYWNLNTFTEVINSSPSFPSVSRSTLWRVLNRRNFNFKQYKYWLRSNNKDLV